MAVGTARCKRDSQTERSPGRIKQRRTDYPIDSFRLARDAGGPLREVGVYGFDGEHRELQRPIGEITEVPSVCAVDRSRAGPGN